MTSGNGIAPKGLGGGLPASLFVCKEEDCGHIEGIGHVAIREAILEDVWDVLEMAQTDPGRFSRVMLAKALVIDGKPMTEDELKRVPFSKFRLLQDLLPRVLRVNGMAGSEPKEETGKAGKKSSEPPVA